MSHTTITGTIDAVFAHRFVVATDDGGKILADIGAAGTAVFDLAVGIKVAAQGEMKPSELKVSTIARDGGRPIAIAHGKPGHARDESGADPEAARAAIEKAGFAVVGEPRRKPKHFEVLGAKHGRHVECHVGFDGTIRKEKPIEAGDERWATEIASAA